MVLLQQQAVVVLQRSGHPDITRKTVGLRAVRMRLRVCHDEITLSTAGIHCLQQMQ